MRAEHKPAHLILHLQHRGLHKSFHRLHVALQVRKLSQQSGEVKDDLDTASRWRRAVAARPCGGWTGTSV